MKQIDKQLENLVKEVELFGRSGGESIFMTNLSFTVGKGDFEVPTNANVKEAISDFKWFLQCARHGIEEPHHNPDSSFWLKTWGPEAQPYGTTWNLRDLADNIQSVDAWRRGMLYNPWSTTNPPCILCYQFQQAEVGVVDVTVSMRSSDIGKVLPQDLMMTYLLLEHVGGLTGLEAGDITFNIANAHVYYEDCEWQEEFAIDDGL